MTMGKAIRRFRQSEDLTQEEFGRIAGVSAMAVSQWENGRSVPRMNSIEKIADHFNVPKAVILDEQEQVEVLVETRKEKPDTISPEDKELLALFAQLKPEDKAVLIQVAARLAVK